MLAKSSSDPGKSISITDIIKASQSLPDEHPKEEEKKDAPVSNQPTDWWKASGSTSDKPSFSETGFRVDLTNDDGAGYVGTIYLGSEEQPARVLFDTGSDYLAVTSDLCNDPKLGKQEEDTAVFNSTSLSYVPSGKDLRKCKSTAYTTKSS
jgi:hypothetical protein